MEYPLALLHWVSHFLSFSNKQTAILFIFFIKVGTGDERNQRDLAKDPSRTCGRAAGGYFDFAPRALLRTPQTPSLLVLHTPGMVR